MQQQYFLYYIVNILAVTSPGTCSATAAEVPRLNAFNAVMYITMPVPLRVVMTELTFEFFCVFLLNQPSKTVRYNGAEGTPW